MATRKFTLLDAMVLVAATALALMAVGHVIRDLASDVGHVGQVAFNQTVLRGRTAEDILRDPDLSWLFEGFSQNRGTTGVVRGQFPSGRVQSWA